MRNLLRVGGVLLIGGVLFLAGRSWSDTKAPAARPKTKIGLVNLTYVVMNYEKFHKFNRELQAVVKPHQDTDANLKKQVEALAEEAKDPTVTAQRLEQIKRKGTSLTRAIERNKAAAQKVVAGKREEQLKILNADVEAATRRYAHAHDLELVMHYHDAFDKAERDSGTNIARKFQVEALMPMYVAPGLDISREILTALNDGLRKQKSD